MKRAISSLILLVLTVWGVGAADLETVMRFDSLHWSNDRNDTAAGRTFDGQDLFWTAQGSISQDLGDGMTFVGGVDRDPVLRWRTYAKLGFNLEKLALQFTPFLGTFNTFQRWFNPGLEAQVGYTWPGVMFVRGGFLTTFAPVAKAGDYYLSGQSAAVGFLSENGIVTLSIEDREATFEVSSSLTTVDTEVKSVLDTEIFVKRVPVRGALLLGYQYSARSYLETSEVVTSLHSGLLGARLTWDLGGGTWIWTEGTASILTIGWDQTTYAVGSSTALFQSSAGLHYHW